MLQIKGVAFRAGLLQPGQERLVQEVGPPEALHHDADDKECPRGQRDDCDWRRVGPHLPE